MPKLRSLGTSRKGRPLLGLQTIIDRLKKTAEAAPTHRQVIDAARTLQQDPRTRAARYRDSAVIGGALSPVVRGIGRAVEAGVMAPKGQRLRAAAQGAMKTNKGEVLRHAVEGGLGGSAIRAANEGAELSRARNTIHSYLSHGSQDKLASDLKSAVKTFADKYNRKLPPISSPDLDIEVA